MWITTVTYENESTVLGDTYHHVDSIAWRKMPIDERQRMVPLLCGQVFERTEETTRFDVIRASKDGIVGTVVRAVSDVVHDEEHFRTAKRCEKCSREQPAKLE